MPTAVTRATKQPQETAHDPRPFPGLRRFTVAEYQAMTATGLFDRQPNCELINGLVVEKMGTNPPHASAITRLSRRLLKALGDDWVIREQSAITLKAQNSEPEPDLVVAKGPESNYDRRHPSPKDVVLVIEVADSSLEVDRTVKCELYAAAKIPAYWLINLRNRLVEVYTLPKGGKQPGYRQKTEYQPDESIDLPIGDISTKIRVTELLPKKA